MIISFGSKETQKIWEGEFAKKLPPPIQSIARRKLRMINNSADINDLRVPPANHLEKLIGDWIGYYSIRINRQWRIVFQWKNGNAFNVQTIDYH